LIQLLSALIVLIGLQHFLFMLLETYYWTKPLGLKVFHLSQTQAEAQKVLASNQGVYNGFIGAGLFWSVLHPDSNFSEQLMIFFLTCVVIAGIWGGITFSKRIIWVQALPALIALLILLFV
jgi:putative membrane protein